MHDCNACTKRQLARPQAGCHRWLAAGTAEAAGGGGLLGLLGRRPLVAPEDRAVAACSDGSGTVGGGSGRSGGVGGSPTEGGFPDGKGGSPTEGGSPIVAAHENGSSSQSSHAGHGSGRNIAPTITGRQCEFRHGISLNRSRASTARFRVPDRWAEANHGCSSFEPPIPGLSAGERAPAVRLTSKNVGKVRCAEEAQCLMSVETGRWCTTVGERPFEPQVRKGARWLVVKSVASVRLDDMVMTGLAVSDDQRAADAVCLHAPTGMRLVRRKKHVSLCCHCRSTMIMI